MNEHDHTQPDTHNNNGAIATAETVPAQEAFKPELLHELFSQLNPRDVEQFYKNYQLWSLQQLRDTMVEQITTLRRKIVENTEQMEREGPSALALANLAQLQACGVEDVDLLDTLLERGEAWLDHTIQLLERCERLDLIGGDYTEWCQHALEGAYDWLASMSESGTEAPPAAESMTADDEEPPTDLTQVTEELLLRKLMSEEEEEEAAEETSKQPAPRSPRITQPLPPLEETAEAEAAIEETRETISAEPSAEVLQTEPSEPAASTAEVPQPETAEAIASAAEAPQADASASTSEEALPIAAYAPVPQPATGEQETVLANNMDGQEAPQTAAEARTSQYEPQQEHPDGPESSGQAGFSEPAPSSSAETLELTYSSIHEENEPAIPDAATTEDDSAAPATPAQSLETPGATNQDAEHPELAEIEAASEAQDDNATEQKADESEMTAAVATADEQTTTDTAKKAEATQAAGEETPETTTTHEDDQIDETDARTATASPEPETSSATEERGQETPGAEATEQPTEAPTHETLETPESPAEHDDDEATSVIPAAQPVTTEESPDIAENAATIAQPTEIATEKAETATTTQDEETAYQPTEKLETVRRHVQAEAETTRPTATLIPVSRGRTVQPHVVGEAPTVSTVDHTKQQAQRAQVEVKQDREITQSEADREEKKKPQSEKPVKKRGFFRRLWARIWHR